MGGGKRKSLLVAVLVLAASGAVWVLVADILIVDGIEQIVWLVGCSVRLLWLVSFCSKRRKI